MDKTWVNDSRRPGGLRTDAALHMREARPQRLAGKNSWREWYRELERRRIQRKRGHRSFGRRIQFRGRKNTAAIAAAFPQPAVLTSSLAGFLQHVLFWGEFSRGSAGGFPGDQASPGPIRLLPHGPAPARDDLRHGTPTDVGALSNLRTGLVGPDG